MALVDGNPQYGDMKRLTQLSSGLKQSNADSVPTIRTPAGRPAGSTTTPAPVASPAAAVGGIPEEHLAIMDAAGRAVRTAGIAKQMAADPMASPWVRFYAQRAEADAADKLRQVKELTPNYAAS